MKAFGLVNKPSKLQLIPIIEEVELAKPVPSKNEVIVQTIATTINPDDLYSMRGTVFGGIPMFLRASSAKPFIPGMDIAGVVDSIGANIDSLRTGDRVYGFIPPWQRLGAWSEFVAVNTKYLNVIPDGWSFTQAAANGVAGATASNAVAHLDYKRSKLALVVGASGGIGSLILQILAKKGLTVIAVCSKSNFQMVTDLGAHKALDYHDGELDEQLEGEFRNLDVVIDCVGGSEIELQAKKVLRDSGVFITLVGPEKQVGSRHLGLHVFTLIGRMIVKMALGTFSSPKYQIANGSLNWSNIKKFQITCGANAVISKELGFSKAGFQEAIEIVASHHTGGKIVCSKTANDRLASEE